MLLIIMLTISCTINSSQQVPEAARSSEAVDKAKKELLSNLRDIEIDGVTTSMFGHLLRATRSECNFAKAMLVRYSVDKETPVFHEYGPLHEALFTDIDLATVEQGNYVWLPHYYTTMAPRFKKDACNVGAVIIGTQNNDLAKLLARLKQAQELKNDMQLKKPTPHNPSMFDLLKLDSGKPTAEFRFPKELIP